MSRFEQQLYGVFAAMEQRNNLQPETKMTTTTTIRRNADGQQNLTDLRRELAASKNMIHRQGGSWITQQWSEAHGAYIENPMPHWFDERNAIQWVLGLPVETADVAAMHAGR